MNTPSPVTFQWILGAVCAVSPIAAFIADVCLVDETKLVRARIERFEHWLSALPLRAVIRWHLNYVAEKIETLSEKLHPDWNCFMVGFLITALLSAHSIIVYGPALTEGAKKMSYIQPFDLPPILQYPLFADLIGGFVGILVRRLLLWARKTKLLYMYFSVIVYKAFFGFLVLMLILPPLFRVSMDYVAQNPHLAQNPSSINTQILAHRMICEAMPAIRYYGLCISNALFPLDLVLYCFQFSLLLWMLSHISFFITKATRLLLKKADGMYFTGAVGACSGFTALLINANPYFQALPPVTWSYCRFFFGLGH